MANCHVLELLQKLSKAGHKLTGHVLLYGGGMESSLHGAHPLTGWYQSQTQVHSALVSGRVTRLLSLINNTNQHLILLLHRHHPLFITIAKSTIIKNYNTLTPPLSNPNLNLRASPPSHLLPNASSPHLTPSSNPLILFLLFLLHDSTTAGAEEDKEGHELYDGIRGDGGP
ncbi:hypothetical protein PIB30_071188 [Stylosanthes scabra]|uniref:Uncharacterized protein n=1 Tax=Stylosanthes scabra TaxID=79078 RepID=A0ABU6VND4_9FABA|nr:hypothetical protein [Stylosanthes scabra]